jgi:hypothetical protein
VGKETEEVRLFRVVDAEAELNWAKNDMDVREDSLFKAREGTVGISSIDSREV